MQNPVEIIATALHKLVRSNGGVSGGSEDMRADAVVIVDALAEEGAILWKPIEGIPMRIRGAGNDILLWCDGEAALGYWSDSGPQAGNWLDGDGQTVGPSHYAVLNAPAR